MRKILSFISNNVLFFATIFLLAFIPLYPKLPLFDIINTWVYVRAEDFAVAIVGLLWISLLISKKITLKTPLTIPIFLFWIVGGVATLHGVLLIFPLLSNVFANVAFLNFIRRIEYLSLFFIAYEGIKEKKSIYYVISTLIVVFLLVAAYGFGQKLLGFPAYLTMNEEFAKGVPITLSQLSRLPSTFGGHYDLAAYLVLILPIFASLFFGFKNLLVKAILLASIVIGFALIFFTVSRVSFFVLFMALILVLVLQKRKLLLGVLSIAGVALLISSFFIPAISSSRLLARFGNTVKEANVLVNSDTGEVIGNAKFVPPSYFKDKIIYIGSASDRKDATASTSSTFLHKWLPNRAVILTADNLSTGEALPQGTGYINLPMSPVTDRMGRYFYETSNNTQGSSKTIVYYGDYVTKTALAYDLSFTTRFQGEWPKTITAFKRNIFLGSGYSAVTLAVDNDYLRLLGETGILGFIAFMSIFIFAGIYIIKTLPKVNSPVLRSFVLGFVAGTFGLALNAIFIDVFEASKVAFTYYLLLGIVIGTLHLYPTSELDLYQEFKRVASSNIAVVIYLLVIMIFLYGTSAGGFFVADDFTWLRWAAECSRNVQESCPTVISGIVDKFTHSDGFFYRPGTKLYFSLMYSVFWLNQNSYHYASFALHFLVVVLAYFLARKVLKSTFYAAATSILFLILSGYAEAVFWISAIGFLFTTLFTFSAILFYALWKEKRRNIYFVASFVSIILAPLFQELGIVAPLLVILYDIIIAEKSFSRELINKSRYLWLLLPLLPYFVLRFISNSHWSGGDYNYNLIKLPFNVIGNTIGYLMLTVFGSSSFPIYSILRSLLKENIVVAIFGSVVLLFLIFVAAKLLLKKIDLNERRILAFSFLFFFISLLPFLGLGNITSRYSYLATFGIAIVLVLAFKTIYQYMLFNGRNIAILSTIGICLVFGMFHLFQIVNLQEDWRVAGEGTKRFLTSMNKVYSDKTSTLPTQFYFVNVPVKNGQAWVFPTGIVDAIWFTFQNKNIMVNTTNNLDDALNMAGNVPTSHVFLFESNGKAIEVVKPSSIPSE